MLERLSWAPLVAGLALVLIVLRLWSAAEEELDTFTRHVATIADLQARALAEAPLGIRWAGSWTGTNGILNLATIDPRIGVVLVDNGGAVLGSAGAPAGDIRVERQVVANDGHPIGRLSVFGSYSLVRLIANDIVVLMLGAVLAVAGAGLVLKYRIGRPLKLMIDAMEHIDSRHWRTVDWASHGQLGRVVSAFNRMIARLSAEQRDMGEAMRAAERTARTKEEFVAQVGHELRTPLTAIMGFSEVLKDELFGQIGSVRYRDYAAGIHSSGTRLLQVIDGMVDLDRANTGRFELIERAFDPGATVESVVQLIRERADAAGIAISTEVQPQIPRLLGDELRIKQALVHLISNALRFTAEGGEIWVAVRHASGGGLELVVGDTGIGMDGGIGMRTEGSGLGLPLVRALCELHQAQVSIDSAAGVGTLVTMYFPPERAVERM